MARRQVVPDRATSDLARDPELASNPFAAMHRLAAPALAVVCAPQDARDTRVVFRLLWTALACDISSGYIKLFFKPFSFDPILLDQSGAAKCERLRALTDARGSGEC